MSNTPAVLARLRKAAQLPKFSLPGTLGKTNVGGGIFGSNGVPTQGEGPRTASRGTGALIAAGTQREILNTCVRATDSSASSLIQQALAAAEDANISVIGAGTVNLTALAGASGIDVRGKNTIALSRGARLSVDRSAAAANNAVMFNLIQGSVLTVELCPGLSPAGLDVTSGSTGNASLARCAGDNIASFSVVGWGDVNITGGAVAAGVSHPTATPTRALFSSIGTIAWTFGVAAGGTTTWTWYPSAGSPFAIPGNEVTGASFAELLRFSSRFLRDAVVLVSAFTADQPPAWLTTVAAQNVRASISGTLDAGGAAVSSFFGVQTDEEATHSEITVVYSFTVAAGAAVASPLFTALAPGGTPRGRIANLFVQSTTDVALATATGLTIVAQSAEDVFVDASAHDGPVDFTGTLNLEADGLEFEGMNDVTLSANDVDLQLILSGILAVTTFDLRRLVMVDDIGGNAHTLAFNRAGDLNLQSITAVGSVVTFSTMGIVGALGPVVNRLVMTGPALGAPAEFTTVLDPLGATIDTVELQGGSALAPPAEIGMIGLLSIGTAALDGVIAAAATALSAIPRIVADVFPGSSVPGAAVLDAAPLVGRTAF